MHKFDKRGPKLKRRADQDHQKLVKQLNEHRSPVRVQRRRTDRPVDFTMDDIIPIEVTDKFQEATGLDPHRRKGVRLASCAIVRGSSVYSGFKSHAELRASLNDDDPYTPTPGDQSGFLTSHGDFVTRKEAVEIGVVAGQLRPEWRTVGRELLSSDIHW